MENTIDKYVLTYHPLERSFLITNKSAIDWGEVSKNENIIWTKEILSEFDELFNWTALIENKGINWKDPDLFTLATEHGVNWLLFQRRKLNWTKEDYYNLKITKSLKDFWLSIQDDFLQENLDWTLDEFIQEYDWFKEKCGPFVQQDYNSFTGELKETNCYHSLSTYEIYLNRLDKVFESYWKKYTHSENTLIRNILYFSEYADNHWNSFYVKKNWEYLSKSTILPWDKNLIKKFSKSWHWKNLLKNESIEWTKDTLDLFSKEVENFSWENDFDELKEINAWNGLLLNNNLKIELSYLASKNIPFNWKFLAYNKQIIFSKDFLDYIHDELFVFICRNDERGLIQLRQSFFKNLHKNDSIKWTYEMLRKYRHLLNWTEPINSFNDGIWKLKKLSHFDGFFYSIDFIDEFSDVLDFKFLSSIQSIEWNKEFIIKYKELWDWKELKQNSALFWEKEYENLYEKFYLPDEFGNIFNS